MTMKLSTLTALAGVGAAFAVAYSGATSAEAKGACVKKAARGEAFDQSTAKLQVDEALLQSVDWGAWAAWMSSGATPGYTFGARSYKCSPGGMGTVCTGSSTICKL